MTSRDDLEQRLAELYASESLLRAPNRVLETALARVEVAPQHRVARLVHPGLRGLVAGSRFAIAAALVIAVTAVALALLASGMPDVGGRPGGAPTESPTGSRPNEIGSGNFVVPFTYVLPPEQEFDYGTRNATYFEIRMPAAAEAGTPAGVIVQAIGGGLVDPCNPASPYLPLSVGPQAVIEYLKTVPGMTVTDEATANVGALPAAQAMARAGAETPDCPDLRPWMEHTDGLDDIPRDLLVRIVAVDVGTHVVFTVFGEDANPDWNLMAEELIDSFRFGTPDLEEIESIFRTPHPEAGSPQPP